MNAYVYTVVHVCRRASTYTYLLVVDQAKLSESLAVFEWNDNRITNLFNCCLQSSDVLPINDQCQWINQIRSNAQFILRQLNT